MKNKAVLILALMISVFLATPAFAVTVSLDPADQTIALGGPALVDINISGLGESGPDSLGAFVLDLTYDSAILSLDSVTFGMLLGDPDLFEADTYYDDLTAGYLYLDEVSWLSGGELNALQSADFTLATLAFTGIGLGVSTIDFGLVDWSDALGSPYLPAASVEGASVSVQPVPAPATLSLMLAGVSALALGRRRRKVTVKPRG